MNLRTLATFLRTPRIASKLALLGDLNGLSRLHFLRAAADLGLLKVLKTPSRLEDIARQLGAERTELLDGLLDLGVSVGELTGRDGVYGLKGKRARLLADEDADAYAAYLQEALSYHGSVYEALDARIKGAPLGDYLTATADLVARSSRTLEPLMRDFVRAAVRSRHPHRLLEIGCGSGVYLRHAAEAAPGLTGTGIDLHEAAVRQARENLRAWGLSARFDVRRSDIRSPETDLGGPYDMATLYNNLYYFPPDGRTALFRTIRPLLADNGTLAIVSLMRGASVASRNFDVVLRSTQGCYALPDAQETARQLAAADFRDVEVRIIMPSAHFAGLLARA